MNIYMQLESICRTLILTGCHRGWCLGEGRAPPGPSFPDPPSMTYQLDLHGQEKKGENMISIRVKQDGWLSVDIGVVICWHGWHGDGCVGVEHTRTASSHLGREGEEKTKKKGFRRHPRFYCRGVCKDDEMVTLDHN